MAGVDVALSRCFEPTSSLGDDRKRGIFHPDRGIEADGSAGGNLVGRARNGKVSQSG